MILECVLLSASLCHAVKDKPVMALTAAHTASAIADGITTKGFERHDYIETQSAWILGKQPTASRMALVWVPEIIVETWIAERMHRSHSWVRHVWWLPQTFSISVHAGGSIRNLPLQHAKIIAPTP